MAIDNNKSAKIQAAAALCLLKLQADKRMITISKDTK
jgi:hypothetical protein